MRTPTVVSLIVFAAVAVAAATPPVPLRTVTGEVVDAAGRPLAGATVRAIARYHAEHLGDDDGHDEPTMPAVRTGRDGTFRLEVPVAASPVMGLEVSHRRHVAVRRQLVPGFRDVDLPTARLPARGAATVVVLDPAGHPAPGVRLRARSLAGDVGDGWQVAPVWVRSDEAGRLPVPGVAGRIFWSGVGPQGWLRAVVDEPGAVAELRLDPVREARVVDEDGEPLSGRVVWLGWGVLGTADGAVALPEEPETWERLWLRQPDGSMRRLHVEVPAEREAPLRLVASAPEAAPALRVAVTDAASGAPIAGAYVLAGIDRVAVTGPRGVADLPAEAAVAEWGRQMLVIAEGYTPEGRELASGSRDGGDGPSTIDVSLRTAWRLHGVVHAAGSPPRPLSGARVELLPVPPTGRDAVEPRIPRERPVEHPHRGGRPLPPRPSRSAAAASPARHRRRPRPLRARVPDRRPRRADRGRPRAAAPPRGGGGRRGREAGRRRRDRAAPPGAFDLAASGRHRRTGSAAGADGKRRRRSFHHCGPRGRDLPLARRRRRFRGVRRSGAARAGRR